MTGREVDRRIVAVAVPAFVALICEPLLLLADTAVVGHLGTTELGGLAAASVVLGTVVGLCIFLAYGGTAAVARHVGAGREAEAVRAGLGSLWTGLGLGVVLGAATVGLAGPVSRLLASSKPVADRAEAYLVVSAAGIPAMLLVLAATGALRGVLDLRTPLVVTIVLNLANIVLTVSLVYGAGLGIRGAALGTVLAQWGAALWLVTVWARRAHRARVPIRPTVGPVLGALRDGVPLLVRTLSLRAALVLATVVAADLGTDALAAHQVVTAVVTFLAYALDAIAIAGQTLIGQSLGAGRFEEARALTRRMVGWGIGTGVLAGLVIAAGAPWWSRAFTPDDDVRALIVPALLVVALIQPISGVVFVLDGVLIGAGDGRYLAGAGTVVLLLYAPVALTVGALGFTWLWAAYGVFILARAGTLVARARTDRWVV